MLAVYSITCSLIASSTHYCWLIHSITCSLIDSSTHDCVDSITCSLINSSTHDCWLIDSITCSLIDSSTHDCWLIDSGDSDKGVGVLFTSLDFEAEYTYSGDCAYDFLEFHDGRYSKSIDTIDER